MTTLRDRIAYHQFACDRPFGPWRELPERERAPYYARADAILALFRDDAPPSDEELLEKGRAIADELGPTLLRMHKRVPFGTVRDTAGIAYCHAFRAGHARGYAKGEAERDKPHAALAATDVCWHCKVMLDPTRPRCERCPEECDDADCREDGREATAPGAAT